MKNASTSRNRKRKRQKNPKPSKEEPKETTPNNKNNKKSQKETKIYQHGGGSSASSKRPKSSNFLDLLRERLSGGQFRMLNEKLYTCSGQEALDYFKEDPEMFEMYHSGYQQQMSNWPELPVNSIINWLLSRSSSLVVADFGCGDAKIAKSVKNKVFSFDLVSKNPSVIACDMSSTPLESSSVDVAVFCLSLMGTNYSSYIKEAHRVLRPSGWLLIAEVKSRFDPNNGGADPKDFVKAVCDLGFTSALKDFSNKMFILLHFKKKEQLNSNQKKIEWPELKACLYKRR
ncbi:Ribosomal RNA-processing protein 8 [Cardamine amara subsp. amara]|uniref:Ribosomal RNA-processing protein 8 n=1 Tax=Cardamine amara subsp. amara TaxID=228776 RepID=A0ABD1B2F6_CARAN